MSFSYDKLKIQINTFFKKLYGDDSQVSSKRVVGFNSFMMICVCVVVALFGGPIVPEFMYYGLIALTAGCFGLNTIESIKALQAKTDVASTIAQSDSSSTTNDAAKDVIQADQPK